MALDGAVFQQILEPLVWYNDDLELIRGLLSVREIFGTDLAAAPGLVAQLSAALSGDSLFFPPPAG